MKGTAFPPSRARSAEMSRDAAEELAIEALTFLAGEPARLERFLVLSGLDPSSLRAAAESPHFLVAVLDHISSEEDLLLAFATNAGRDPAAITRARRVLAPDPET